MEFVFHFPARLMVGCAGLGPASVSPI